MTSTKLTPKAGGILPEHVGRQTQPEPTEPPTESPQQRKKEFLQNVDESISGDRIAGNPYKFVGDDVDLHGTVQNVLNDSHFNMSTGDVESGDWWLTVSFNTGYGLR